jgi:hypothetical protein
VNLSNRGVGGMTIEEYLSTYYAMDGTEKVESQILIQSVERLSLKII